MTLGLKNQKKGNESHEKSPAQLTARGSGKGAKESANGGTNKS
jgi:hypothetical protein